MNTKKGLSIVAIVTVAAAIFALSSVLVKPAIAQTVGGGGEDDGTGPSSTGPSSTGPSSTGPSSTGPSSTGPSSTGPSSTGPSSEKYQEFKNCLSDAEKNGVVTEQQIRDCFSPVYNAGGSDDTGDDSSSESSSSDTGSTSGTSDDSSSKGDDEDTE
jgi:hypothetical protein